MDGKVPVQNASPSDNGYRRCGGKDGQLTGRNPSHESNDVLNACTQRVCDAWGGRRVVAYRVGLSGRAKALRKIKSRIIGDSVPAMHNDYPAICRGRNAQTNSVQITMNNMITSVSKCEFRTLHAFTDEKQTFTP